MADEFNEMLSGLGEIVTTAPKEDEKNDNTLGEDVNSPEPENGTESISKTEETPSGEKVGGEEKKTIEPEKKERTFEDFFKEKTGLDWADDYVEKIKTEPKEDKPYEYRSDFAKKLDDYVAQGGS